MHFVFPTIRNRNLKQWYAICFWGVGGGGLGETREYQWMFFGVGLLVMVRSLFGVFS